MPLQALAARPAVLPLGGAACLRPTRPGLSNARPAQRTLRRTLVAAGGQDPQQGERKQEFPTQAANARRQQIQQERSAIWGRIGDLTQGDSDDDDSTLIDLVGDEFKEADRKNLRTVFDFDRWKKHRSASRYLRHVRATFTSRILQGLAVPMIYVTGLSVAVATWHAAAELGYTGPIPDLKIDSTFSLTSFALSLLLAYRTNSSYGRWDEARKMWGSMVNRSRDFVRMGLAYIPDDQPGLQAGLVRWMIAYTRALMCHLRDTDDLRTELTGILTPRELDALLASTHRPNYCMQVLGGILREARLPGWSVDNTKSFANVKASAFVRMDEQLTVFSDVTGGCERILRTPIPLSYTRHTSRFLIIWLTLVPFTLWNTCGWAMVPVSCVVAFLLLGIEEIGVLIEEPFSILPLETISRTIETNVRELEARHGAEAAAARAASAGGLAGAGALPGRVQGSKGEIEAAELVRAIVPEAELKKEWGPEWEVLSGTGGPAAVPATANSR